MQIDLHGYRPSEIVWNGRLIEIVRKCWELGETELVLIHGHGRARGKTPGFYNTKTGETAELRKQTQAENMGWYAGIVADIFT